MKYDNMDRESLLIALDQLTQTVEVMGSLIQRLQVALSAATPAAPTDSTRKTTPPDTRPSTGQKITSGKPILH